MSGAVDGQPGFVCHQVGLTYESRNGRIAALVDLSFTAAGREFISVIGPSGCGKTTLLKLISGLIEPTSGRIEFLWDPPDGLPRDALVFQEHGVFPWMTVVDNVAFGLEAQAVPRAERRARARDCLARFGLSGFDERYPHELSVGMRQRVGIARAFVTGVPLLLLDEPFGSLDAQTRVVLQEELIRIWRDDRKLAVYVTHDIEEAILLGDRVLVLSGRPGRILEDISVPLDRPRSLDAREQPIVNEIRWHIWKLLESEVRAGLKLGS